MKLKIQLMVLLAALCMVSCDKDDPTDPVNENLAKEIEGKYDGYVSAEFQYTKTPMVTPDESISIKANEDGTASVTYTSGEWGDFTIEAAKIIFTNNEYKFEGSGKTLMGMGDAPKKEYDCTVTGVISKDKKTVSMVFKVPAVMGGVTITFTPGEAPVDLLVAGSYKGELDVVVMGTSQINEKDFTITIKSQGEGKVEITVPGFGEAPMGFSELVIKDIAVEKTAKGDYTLKGDVNAMSGSINVTGDVSGNIPKGGKAVITFTLKPGSMPMNITATFTEK